MRHSAISQRSNGLGVYIHWPFCMAKCPYCDFNSHVRLNPVDQKRFVRAILTELSYMKSLTGERQVTSIFFGGGTPSLIHPENLDLILKRITECWPLSADIEITLEANPVSVEIAQFSDYRKSGVNRISVGVQALNDQDLKRLGRIHDIRQAYEALEAADRIFDRYSFDLIYARPDQTVAAWQSELRQALPLAKEHISLYQLTIEPGTQFFRQYQTGKLSVPDDDLALRLYEVTQEECERAGFPAYEISNHAGAGCESRHNLLYWRYGEYIGAGPGAHGRIIKGKSRYATRTERNPEKWLTRVEKYGNGLAEQEELSPLIQAEEFLMMGLRLAEGINLKDLFCLFPHSSFHTAQLDDLVTAGLVDIDGECLKVTRQGRLVLNTILAHIIALLD